MTIGLNLGINLGFFDHHGRPRLGHHCHGKWVEIPNLDSPCMQEISRFAVEEYNHRYRKNLTYQFTYAAWYLEVDARSVKYRLHIQVVRGCGRIKRYEAIVLERNSDCGREKILESFKRAC